MRPYDASFTSTSFREIEAAPTPAAPCDAFTGRLCDGLVRAYAVTLPLFLLAFFVVKRLDAEPVYLFMLALLWVATTLTSGAWLAVKDRRQDRRPDLSRGGTHPASTMAAGGRPRQFTCQSVPPTTSATCRPGSTGPRPRTGTTSARTASRSRT